MEYDRYHYLRTERQPDGVLLITLSRPEVLNAAHEEMHTEMAGIWSDIDKDDQTRVAVVTGAGRAFSAGGDLAMVERQIGNYGLVTRMLTEMGELVYNMANCSKPIVSAINGVAVGAGLVVGLLADISICAEDARLGDGHVRLGVAAGDHAAIIWPLLCGLAKAKYYLLTGEMVSGGEAERIGLVSRALPQQDVLPEALRVAARLATGPQQAIRLTKRALNGWLRTAGPIFDQSAAYEMLTFLGEDIKEGLASLREKRAPRFS
jgi:enoyl-CoA hydratase